MTVPCAVTTAEMREALHLNLNSKLVWRLVRGNARLLVYIVVFASLAIVSLSSGQGVDWQKLALFAGLLLVLIALLLLSLNTTAAKTAKALTKSGATFNIDTNGFAIEALDGTHTSIPWSAITRSREGSLVFTIGDENNFRTLSKSALGEIQSGEIRSLLLSQIR